MLIYQRVTPLKNWAKSCCKNHHTKATAIQGSSAAFTTEPSYIGCAVHQYSCNMPIISIVMTIPHQRSELTILPTRKWSISVWMTPRGLLQMGFPKMATLPWNKLLWEHNAAHMINKLSSNTCNSQSFNFKRSAESKRNSNSSSASTCFRYLRAQNLRKFLLREE